MQLPDWGYVILWLAGALGIAWSNATRFLTMLAAGTLFLLNLYTTVGGPFSYTIFFITLFTLFGFFVWVGLDLGTTILSYVAATVYNLTTPQNHVQVPDTSTTNLRDVFVDDTPELSATTKDEDDDEDED